LHTVHSVGHAVHLFCPLTFSRNSPVSSQAVPHVLVLPESTCPALHEVQVVADPEHEAHDASQAKHSEALAGRSGLTLR
jgi:hypothetical protein